MPTDGHDVAVLRGLAARYAEVAARPEYDERRDLWRRHNSLRPTRPLLLVRGGRFWDEVPECTELECREEFYRGYERQLRRGLYRTNFEDDWILEPWLTVRARHRCTGWGVEAVRSYSADDELRGSFKADYPLKAPEDIDKLRPPRHEIDEDATRRDVQRLGDAVGDLVAINVDRGPAYRVWTADISTDLGYLRGIEHFMLDMIDRPQWLHRLAKTLADGILRTHEQAEAAGDWGLANHENQAMPYAEELSDPAPNAFGVPRGRLWVFAAAQEFALVSPAMHEEFLLRYQLPILSAFALTAYGCCEDLTRKIGILRQIRNLRRIAVTPWADVKACAEQIGTDYVISWRPSPAEMVCTGFDEGRVRRTTREALEACRGLHVDVTLKDIDTVQGDPTRVVRWARATREVCEAFA
jgi:hypothetical protein